MTDTETKEGDYKLSFFLMSLARVVFCAASSLANNTKYCTHFSLQKKKKGLIVAVHLALDNFYTRPLA